MLTFFSNEHHLIFSSIDNIGLKEAASFIVQIIFSYRSSVIFEIGLLIECSVFKMGFLNLLTQLTTS